MSALRKATYSDLALWILGRRQRHRVVGASMVPELHDGEEVLVDRRAYRRCAVTVGDVVLVTHPTQGATRIIKRVSGVSSEGVMILGDNQEESTDSRHFGPVSEERVLGQVVARFDDR